MKKRLAILTAATLLCTGLGIFPITTGAAEKADTVRIGVDDPFYDMNILTATKLSATENAVFTMAYDTLLTLDNEGNIQPGLIESWESPDNIVSDLTIEVLSQTWDSDESCPPPGWENFPPKSSDSRNYIDANSDEATIYTLREELKFQNGVRLTAYEIEDYIAFAKLQPTDTLIYKMWAPVTIVVYDERTFSFFIDMYNYSMGNMDFNYLLTSPISSIVYVEDPDDVVDDEIPLGTGAYRIDSVEIEKKVTLERWEDWWNPATVPTQYVTFINVGSLDDARVLLENNGIDVAFVNNAFLEQDAAMEALVVTKDTSNAPEKTIVQYDGKQVPQIGYNPISLFFNTETGLFSNEKVREAVMLALDKESILAKGYLLNKANGIWCYYEERMDYADYHKVKDPNPASSYEEKAQGEELSEARGLALFGELPEDNTITLIAQKSDLFGVYATYYEKVVEEVQANVEALYENENLLNDITVEVIYATESEIAEYESNGNYDMILREIDVWNINSAYNTLYGKVSLNIDDLLEKGMLAADAWTYAIHCLGVQWESLSYLPFVNLGFQGKVVLQNANVSGFTAPDGFCPTGNIGRIDFRWLSVTTD